MFLNADRSIAGGTLDPSFGNGGRVNVDFGGNDYSHTVLIQSDGKIVVVVSVGNPFQFPPHEIELIRYNTNGSLDTSFDGDGNADLTVFRPGTSVWWLLKSGTSTTQGQQWGISTDVPVPAAFIP